MKVKIAALFLILVYQACYCEKRTKSHVRKFPNKFMFGAATSAPQVEGAWNEDGKTESIWDNLLHSQPSVVRDNSTNEVAANSYHMYKRDVQMMRELGLDFYRFSLAWPRILPSGFPDQMNKPGIDYYNNLINEMLKHNIQPMVTLYHWDLPQKLQDLGGWTNPNIVDWFSDYARLAFKLFGDRVKYWITLNEPMSICYYSYSLGLLAPRYNYSGVADYMCAKNLLMAHAKAYHIYDKEFRRSQGGSVSMSIVAQWYDSESEENAQAAEDSFQFHVGIYSHPIYSKAGGWPEVLTKRVAAKSKKQGFLRSRLPLFTPQEKKYVRGTADFFGLNHYSTNYVYRNASSTNKFARPSTDDDLGVTMYAREESIRRGTYVPIVPSGMYKVLMKIKNDYDNPIVMITENGYATRTGLADDDRVYYYRQYMSAVLDAIDAGANVRAYTAWSLFDNFEWILGYIERFGLYEVNFEDENRTRTPRKSAFVYKQIVRTHALDMNYKPKTTVMTIDKGH